MGDQTKGKARSAPNRRRVLGRFIKNEEGVAAIEVAFLGLPFFFLIFVILEACIGFAAQQLLANATDDVARLFRTGQVRASELNETKLRDLLCDRMSILMSETCPGLEVDLRQFDTFEDAAKSSLGFNDDGSIDTKTDLGPALTKNMMRVYYRWPVVTNLLADRLPDGKLLLFSSNTWQNEPF
ncbi:pilus assembly protein [Nitratireductor sp. B36]|uniref:TadE/TadG family type IV pilus assembly protein n=1 Tax=Nitratireductor sp. B36 TaxID=2762059 RepID=UPI001E2E4475|nr:TadE/TadG family type IV pilus assembly protein [Nitratireductor sp. B36]MCC5780684.1 pilus assembly protein [Nitratireductor sp. B36]